MIFFPLVQLVVSSFSFNSPVVRVLTRNASFDTTQLFNYVYQTESARRTLSLCVTIKLKVVTPVMINSQETTMTKVRLPAWMVYPHYK